MLPIHPLILTCLAMCCLSAPLSADNPVTPTPPTTDTPAASQSGKGTVTKVDTDLMSIDVRVTDAQGKNAMTLVLTMNPSTKITRNKKTATLAQVQSGDLVTFTFTAGTDPSQGTATTVDAKVKSTKSKKGAPATN